MVNTNTIEQKKNSIIQIDNFKTIKVNNEENNNEENNNENNKDELSTNANLKENQNQNTELSIVDNYNTDRLTNNNERVENINQSEGEGEGEDEENINQGEGQDEEHIKVGENINIESETDHENDNEIIDENDLEKIKSGSNNEVNPLLAGGKLNDTEQIFNIDYILADDEKLVNPEKIIKQVDTYINNYNNPDIQKYKKNFKQLYQTYSNKHYLITTITTNKNINKNDENDENITKINKINKITNKIIVTKTDKSKKIVKELTKPSYYFYDENNNLLKLKNNISNNRADLLYKYEKLIAKLNITIEDKKEFEKDKKNFIELLESYYIYTLYHKKINNIITLNKSSLSFQKEFLLYKEDNDNESLILNSDVYLIDNSVINTINTYNTENLNSFNNIISLLTGKKDKEILKDKIIKENIKTYIKSKNEIDLFTQSVLENTNIQDKYINYIIL